MTTTVSHDLLDHGLSLSVFLRRSSGPQKSSMWTPHYVWHWTPPLLLLLRWWPQMHTPDKEVAKLAVTSHPPPRQVSKGLLSRQGSVLDLLWGWVSRTSHWLKLFIHKSLQLSKIVRASVYPQALPEKEGNCTSHIPCCLSFAMWSGLQGTPDRPLRPLGGHKASQKESYRPRTGQKDSLLTIWSLLSKERYNLGAGMGSSPFVHP